MREVQPIRDREKIEEIKTRLKNKNARDWFMFEMGINVGLRISDLLPLRVFDVRGKTHISIKEKKTDKNKRFKINGNMQRLIEEYTKYMEEEDYLFPSNKTDKAIQRVQAYKILNAVGREAGLEEIGTHTLRKTFGYHFYQRTKDVALLQELFNHSAPSVTLKYIGINQDIIDAAIDDFYL
ncbi:site-specific integrase [Bacillus paramycoides]|uniref:site-specific integrase n=1 Tax=Bacillus paramycoides TaxID=2026194 RepID=UPI002E2034DE|nr:site-specific integrase [Bacillus paramycoides]